jgi:conjugal transfer/entry exclusion protein
MAQQIHQTGVWVKRRAKKKDRRKDKRKRHLQAPAKVNPEAYGSCVSDMVQGDYNSK